jgi:hypothetical protein
VRSRPRHEGKTLDVVRITEGPLKADIASMLSGITTIGLPGVGAWKLALPVLARIGAKKVLVAFDADARSNPQVARPLTRIVEALETTGYVVAVEHWPATAGKGIDDVLVGGNAAAIRIAEGPELPHVIADIAATAGVVPSSSARNGTPDEPNGRTADERKSQAKALLELAAGVECFRSPEGQLFADVRIEDRRETWPIGSAAFRQWLALRLYREHDKAAGAQPMNDAVAVLEARARFDGPERLVGLRVAQTEGRIYVDLVNDRWEAVEISRDGWRVVKDPPVRFRRTGGMRALPRPVSGGTLEELRPFLNIDSADDWTLTIAWLLGALRARGPYPLAVLQGEQGSAKSTTARVLRELIDPNTSPLRAKPRDVQELMIAAINGWVICYDNLSGCSMELSDGLCRLSTGGGFSTRQLYTDTDEVLLEAQRPAILTGIDAIATRADLADRSLILTLPPIAEGKRLAEADFWNAFETARPRILGALFTAVAGALANVGKQQLAMLPRMADFATWVTSAESTLGWAPHTFMRAYLRNRGAAAINTVDADPVSTAVQQFVSAGDDWAGSASDLLRILTEMAGETIARSRGWPKTAHKLSELLNRAAPALRTAGIDIIRSRTNHGRTVTLRKRIGAAGAIAAHGDGPAAVGDAANGGSVTGSPRDFPPGDASDAGDCPSPEQEKHSPSLPGPDPDDPPAAVKRVLEHPTIVDAIRLLEPETIDVRLPDRSVWAARRISPSSSEESLARSDERARANDSPRERDHDHVNAQHRTNGI